ncbi:MAG: hypothetical protein H0X39_16815 [Actinobacteria bacterium]|nr:hypothetical protein [Actinomycetota bacterium]
MAAATWWVDAGEEKLDLDWRAGIPARALPGIVRPLTAWPFAQAGGCAIFRTPNTRVALYAITQSKRRGLRVLVESDDAWLTLDARALAARRADLSRPGELAALTHREEARRTSHRLAVEAADAVVVSTPWLADLYRPMNQNVHVCENAVDPADWPDPAKPGDGTVRVGFAGSTSHVGDLDLIRPALAWAAATPGVEAVVIGFDPAADFASDEEVAAAADAVAALTRARRHRRGAEAAITAINTVEAKLAARRASWQLPGLRIVPWADNWPAHRANLATLNVGLAPLAPTDFNRGRSDIKVIEYALSGALPVVQHAEPYKRWHDLLPTATSPEDFLEHVQAAAADPEGTAAHAAELRDRILKERNIAAVIGQWQQAITDEPHPHRDAR